mgnify:CR=1 FL=1
MPESPPVYYLNENRRSTQTIHDFALRFAQPLTDGPPSVALGPDHHMPRGHLLDVSIDRACDELGRPAQRDAGDPVEMARVYDAEGADELTFLDISASHEERATTLEIVSRTAEQVFIPLTVGGGVRAVEDVDRLLRAGADKVAVNTAAINRPELVAEIADRFGNQVLVLSVDARRAEGTDSGFEVTTHGGRRSAGLDAVEWTHRATELGAGLLKKAPCTGRSKKRARS